MDFQIFLLPKRDYWSWVRACRDYVMKYRANLTSDQETAANYMAPLQVISFPTSDRLRAERGDLVSWFEEHRPEIRLDPIEVGGPDELKDALAKRLESDDRYGQRQRPFYLLWPTNYPVITQRFGANPQIYTRFGMPGHEGLDIRALPHTNVYSCADGTVYRVHTNPDSHSYGIHVRIRHNDGYRTVYGHLAQALVEVGEQVQAGQVIGEADSTGASTASHLHLTLKHDGATARKESKYPKDVVDPTPWMVWPESFASKGLQVPQWSADRCLIGVHGSVDGPLRDSDFKLLQRSRVEAVKVSVSEPTETVDILRSMRPSIMIVARLSTKLDGEAVSPQAFVEHNLADLHRLKDKGIRYFEIMSSPNLHVEGWNRSWQDGRGFGTWFLSVMEVLRQEAPNASFGFPGLSPGGDVSGWRTDWLHFLDGADAAAAAADWIGVNCYWTERDGYQSLDGGRRYLYYRDRFPDKLFMITEFSNPAPTIPAEEKARQYRAYYRMLRDEPGVAAAFAYPLAAKDAYQEVAWHTGDRSGEEIAGIIGDRDF
ncbi:MAG: M23 family metallopeptidase [Anaerolineales bacterium]